MTASIEVTPSPAGFVPSPSRHFSSDEDDEDDDESRHRAPPRWLVAAKALLARIQNERSWIVVMAALGTVDMLLNLINFIQMSDPRLQYGLVIGPPTKALWISLCVFTVVGTLLYLLETVNTFSAGYGSSGDTAISIHLELLVTLLFEHIPLATIDYFVARCRRQFTTPVESWCNSVRIVFVFMRLVWYAHIEGKKIRKNDKHEIKQVLVMSCCLLFSVSLAFSIMNWRMEPTIRIKDYHLQNVSIYVLQHMRPPEGRAFNIPITEMLRKQGWTRKDDPFLIRSAFDIYKVRDSESNWFDAIYRCHPNVSRPIECRDDTEFLRFRFKYIFPTETDNAIFPYGEIAYNFARVCPRALPPILMRGGTNRTVYCEDGRAPLGDDWRLLFFETQRDAVPGSIEVKINVSQPFRKTDSSPMPSYRASIRVCGSIEAAREECLPSHTTTVAPVKRRPSGAPTRNRPSYDSEVYLGGDYIA